METNNFKLLLSIVSTPYDSLQKLVDKKYFNLAILLFFVTLTINTLRIIINPPKNAYAEYPELLTYFEGAISSYDIYMIIFVLFLMSIIMLFVGSYVLVFTGRIFKGTGSFKQILQMIVFSGFPYFLASLILYPLDNLSSDSIALTFMMNIIKLGVSIWSFCLLCIGIGIAHQFGGTKGFYTLLLTFIFTFIPIAILASIVIYNIISHSL